MICPHCGKETDVEKNGTQQFIAAYVEAFRIKWKTDPVIGPKNSGIAKRIVASLGVERSKRFAFAYLAMNEFAQRRHDLAAMEFNLNAIQVALETGKIVTRGEARQMDRRQANVNAFGKLLEEESGG